LFLLWRRDIRHPDPEYAVSYAMVMVAVSLRELILFNHARLFRDVVALDDDRRREELPRGFLRYLGVKEKEPLPSLSTCNVPVLRARGYSASTRSIRRSGTSHMRATTP